MWLGVVAIPGSRLRESEGLSPAQLSPPSGTATACCSHIANGGVVVHVFVFNVRFSPNSAAPARFAPLGTLQFSHVTPPFGRNLFLGENFRSNLGPRQRWFEMVACTGGSFGHGIESIEEPTRNPPLVARATGAPTRTRPRALSVMLASGGEI